MTPPRRWTSRKFLLALVGQVVGLIVLFWPEHESEIITASQHISALLIMGLTAFGFIQGEAKIDAERTIQDGQRDSHDKEMRYRVERDQLQREERKAERSGRETTAPMIGLLLASLFITGCATNPVDQYYELQSTANAARNSIMAAHDAGAISDSELVALDPFEKSVRSSLEVVRSRLPRDEDGNLDPTGEVDSDVRWLLDSAEQALDRLIEGFERMSDEPSGDSGSAAHDARHRSGEQRVHGVDCHGGCACRAAWRADTGAAGRNPAGGSGLSGRVGQPRRCSAPAHAQQVATQWAA